ncbi:hypothetical protein PsorP6_011356 [Peronosclerospora sorghi]|uniref:Uncharacterized protein n=1 Tax=Peronosclerospora sorghi TaxID=230839 RepID=A0ACC0WJG2_9STRA|nr:hypothetical protein PsorP6_011356 [Peronosclerospora sorghi]
MDLVVVAEASAVMKETAAVTQQILNNKAKNCRVVNRRRKENVPAQKTEAHCAAEVNSNLPPFVPMHIACILVVTVAISLLAGAAISTSTRLSSDSSTAPASDFYGPHATFTEDEDDREERTSSRIVDVVLPEFKTALGENLEDDLRRIPIRLSSIRSSYINDTISSNHYPAAAAVSSRRVLEHGASGGYSAPARLDPGIYFGGNCHRVDLHSNPDPPHSLNW